MEKPAAGTFVCPWWLLFLFDNPLRSLIHDPQRILAGRVEPGETVLDIGCGMGYFSLTLARMVGENGHVIAADLQERMLAGLRRRAERAGLLERIWLHPARKDQIGLAREINFALAFWMVHEVSHPESFLREIYQALLRGGEMLIVEPVIHVSGGSFERTLALAERVGFVLVDRPRVAASRSALLRK